MLAITRCLAKGPAQIYRLGPALDLLCEAKDRILTASRCLPDHCAKEDHCANFLALLGAVVDTFWIPIFTAFATSDTHHCATTAPNPGGLAHWSACWSGNARFGNFADADPDDRFGKNP
jgi:hypothetical protein